MADWKEDLLKTILDCDSEELSWVGRCQYDIKRIAKICIGCYGGVTIKRLVFTIIDWGLRDMEHSITRRLLELNKIDEKISLYGAEKEEWDALVSLDPMVDIHWMCNKQGIYVWVDATEKIPAYEKYMEEELENFYIMTGFRIFKSALDAFSPLYGG